ncbi:putative abhydrolase domain-containing protein (secreted protein) protein [Neofusicoccum parvum UCRNP2]|uniref:Putative abhydrolase domain-containing protein (Secreted protein) protein n=1 Tax=Botryosphaeria parva (strain UCR-NP2) TaxID=1287680 RepID=R1G9G2_BOTPV|nr:putative abhydrolase domain-containing protein (secreted protein) protein [Neofusicoccum parvum UCRNP2]
MVSLHPALKKAYWGLAGAGALYAVFMLCLTNVTIQRKYANSSRDISLHRGLTAISVPADTGQENQVTAFNVTTLDHEVLYAWHVLPLNVYEKHEPDLALAASGSPDGDFTQTQAFQLLAKDPKARLVINFHGNAGHIAQGWRTDTYRALTSLPHTHLLTLDYRGFGRSTGAPTEAGLIADGVALANYALHTLHVPASRIVIVGQSLGTAVASAVGLHFADPAAAAALLPGGAEEGEKGKGDGSQAAITQLPAPVDFAAVVLIAPFTSLPVLVESYRIFGVIPLLSPLRGYPRVQKWLRARIVDTWNTLGRVEALVAAAASPSSGSSGRKGAEQRRLRLHVIHAKDDFDIPWAHGEHLYQSASSVLQLSRPEDVAVVEEAVAADGGRSGRVRSTYSVDGAVEVRMNLLAWGGHNRVVTFAPVSLAVLRAFEAAAAGTA